MSEHPSNNSPLSPVEQLANVYDSLADDVFDGLIEVDEETNQRAFRIARTARDKALSSGGIPDSPPKTESQSPSAPKPNIASDSSSYASYTRRLRMERFARRFGLHPLTALVLTVISIALNAFGWMTLGLGILGAWPVTPLLGLLTWIMQKRLYGDDNVRAGLKGIAVIVLAVLPIAPFFFVPAGIVGWVWGKTEKRKNKKSRETVHK